MTAQLNLLEWQPRGETINLGRDRDRLGAQMRRVWEFMRTHEWHTLSEISAATGDPEASISARLRDLDRLGWHKERQYVARGLFRYRLAP